MKNLFRYVGRGLVVLCLAAAVVWRFAWPWTSPRADWLFIGLVAVGLVLTFVFKVFEK